VRNLVCRRDSLTIGAPSSPLLSNLVMFDFDERWSGYCRARRIAYSRYADDVYFSTDTPNILRTVLEDLKDDLRRHKSPTLQINDAKTIFVSRKARKIVTGLVVTPDGKISLGRKRKRFIRSQIFRRSRGELRPDEISALQGMLAYAGSVEPSFLESLRRKYGLKVAGDL
jgi:RNA-directed DNA polymerase